MYNDMYNRQKSELENMIRNYQQPYLQDMYEIKILNNTDEAENIFINNNTIFLGSNRMQIKKLDGTIEKYNIERYYPIDEKDEKIKELNLKVEELERRLNSEPTKHIGTNEVVYQSNANVNEYANTTTKAITKSNARQDERRTMSNDSRIM